VVRILFGGPGVLGNIRLMALLPRVRSVAGARITIVYIVAVIRRRGRRLPGVWSVNDVGPTVRGLRWGPVMVIVPRWLELH